MAEDRQILLRIAAVLLALANLAERAAARPFPVLWLVLTFLRPAEAIAARFVADLSGWEAPLDDAAPSAPESSNGARAEALRLALAFRMLAFLLDAAAGAPVCGLSGLQRRAAQAFLAAIENLAQRRPQPADTS